MVYYLLRFLGRRKNVSSLSMKYPTYEMSYLWNVLSMKCPIYEMSYLWNVLSIKCPISIKGIWFLGGSIKNFKMKRSLSLLLEHYIILAKDINQMNF